jgi:hypothetical protein
MSNALKMFLYAAAVNIIIQFQPLAGRNQYQLQTTVNSVLCSDSEFAVLKQQFLNIIKTLTTENNHANQLTERQTR